MSKKLSSESNILIAFLLNLFFSIYEFIGGTITGSIAIVSDAVHDIGDALSIGISYFLERKSKQQPDEHYTYGYIRYSVIGSLITTVILLVGSCFVIYQAIQRFITPSEINYNGMIILAIIGAIVNFLAAYVTRQGDSLNQKSVNLHMLEDVLGWVVVLIGAIIIHFTNFSLIDPILSIIVAGFIFYQAWQNLLSVINVFLEKTPDNISIPNLQKHLLEIPGVENIHHIHIWSMDGYHNCATLHAVCTGNEAKIKHAIKSALAEHHIHHVTVELEHPEETCIETSCHPKYEISHAHHHHHHH